MNEPVKSTNTIQGPTIRMTVREAIRILSQAAYAYANGCEKGRAEQIKRAIAKLKS